MSSRSVITKLLGIAVAGVMVLSSAAMANEADIERRKEAMKVLGATFGMMKKVTKGEAEFSPALVTQAQSAVAVSKIIVTLFPQGSGGEKSRAKDEIWSDWDNFKKAADAFKAAAPQLIEAAKSNDKDKVGATLGAVGKTCGGCHKPYRKPKKK